MNNDDKALRFLFVGLRWGGYGSFVGFIIGIIRMAMIKQDASPTELSGWLLLLPIIIWVSLGFWIPAIIPLMVAKWFLFLHMLGQFCDAIAGSITGAIKREK